MTLTPNNGSFAGGPTVTVPVKRGVARFPGLVFNTAGVYKLTASDGALTHNTSVNLVIANGDYSCNTASVGVSDDAAFQSARECLGAANVGVDQPPVEVQRAGKSLEHFRRTGLESATPQFHRFFNPALTFIGSPIRLIKPSASFWS